MKDGRSGGRLFEALKQASLHVVVGSKGRITGTYDDDNDSEGSIEVRYTFHGTRNAH